jgi:hypothetical protein
MSAPESHVFTRKGDARSEVDKALAELKRVHGESVDAGFNKYMYVTKADMTVVMVGKADSLLAGVLRGRAGWTEPGLAGAN